MAKGNVDLLVMEDLVEENDGYGDEDDPGNSYGDGEGTGVKSS